MKLFGREDRAYVETALAAVEAKLAELHRSRQATLEAPGDQFTAIEQIDKKIEAEARVVSYHRSRLEAIDRQEIQQDEDRIKQERVAFIAELKKRLSRRLAAATKLDNTPLKDLSAAYADLCAACDAVYANWPPVMPPASRFGWTKVTVIAALSPHRSQRMIAGLINEVAYRGPYNFSAEIGKLNDELMAELQGTNLPATDEVAA